MAYKRNFYFVLLISIITKLICAQDFTAGDIITLQVTDYSLIETNHAPVALSLSTTEAGAPLSSASNSDMYLKLSSIVPGGTDREVTVRISSGTVPAGTTLSLVAAPCTLTNSGGALGIPVATPLTLSDVDQNLILYIGSCYTGTGYNDGYQLTYTWAPTSLGTEYSQIESTSTPVNVTVVFTIKAHDGN